MELKKKSFNRSQAYEAMVILEQAELLCPANMSLWANILQFPTYDQRLKLGMVFREKGRWPIQEIELDTQELTERVKGLKAQMRQQLGEHLTKHGVVNGPISSRSV